MRKRSKNLLVSLFFIYAESNLVTYIYKKDLPGFMLADLLYWIAKQSSTVSRIQDPQ